VSDQPTFIDRAIAYLSPKWAAERAYYRAASSSFATSYRGAVRTRLDTAWSVISMGVRQRERNLRESHRQMRERARQLETDNVLAAGVLDRAVENVIGTGIRARPTSSDPEFNRQAAALWKKWTAGKTADVRGALTFGALQRMFYRGKLRDGDCGVLLTEARDSDGLPQPRLQVIESEWIDTPYGNVGDRRIIDGVELNGVDAAAAYWLIVQDENERDAFQRIKARDFVYLARPALYSSVRGESSFNGGYLLFDQIVGYLESVVVASRVGASQALLIKRKNPGIGLGQLGSTTNAAGAQQKAFAVEPGMVHYLGIDEDVASFNPSQPQQQMEAAIRAFSRFVGLKFGLTLEQVLLDFSQTSYSSSRAARLQAEQTAFQEQDDFAATFLARVYPWAVSKWAKNGQITVPMPSDGWAFEWIPQGRPWVDPTKEIRAAAEAVALGVETRSNIATERGYDFHELTVTNAADVKLLSDNGLPTDPLGGKAGTVTVADDGTLSVGNGGGGGAGAAGPRGA
jgi:lambda family phage portal protein